VAFRFHFNRLQINGGDLHAGTLLRHANRVFKREGRGGKCGR
jgi:hypothetical protein